MKRVSIVIALALASLFFAYSQTARAVPPQGVTKIQVTSQTLSSQPAGKPFIIESKPGTVYEIAAGIDYSRAQVRTAQGVTTLGDYVRKFGMNGRFLMGSANALSAIGYGFPNDRVLVPPGGVVAEVKCSGGLCSCKWGKDCDDMKKAKVCTADGDWVCGAGNGTGGTWGCTCAKKA